MELLKCGITIQKFKSTMINRCSNFRYMSSSEVSTALKPFYFHVHPDLFGQYPSERAVNETSLQSLSSFIETVKNDKPAMETILKFYLRPQSESGNLKCVQIRLKEKNLRQTVSSILSSCNLPTTYVDNLIKTNEQECSKEDEFLNKSRYKPEGNQNKNTNNLEYEIRRKRFEECLRPWLMKNVGKAREKFENCQPVRDEVKRLQEEISFSLGLIKLILDCGWNIQHYRGCLASFQALIEHHPSDMKVLRGRTLVFGSYTGVSFDGHVLLNSGEVRHNWLDFIKHIPNEDIVVMKLPAFEKSVSRVLRDIRVVKRKFQPKTMAKQYKNNLKRLTTSLIDHQGRSSYPKEWPASLSDYELVVESEAGPLMVSPTGQFIVPCSCPAALLVNFITDNLSEAKKLNLHYQSHKDLEKDLEIQCKQEFKLGSLEKDDNIMPDLMIKCCTKLLSNKFALYSLLPGVHLYISNYYSIMSDGKMCIPYNWKL